MRPPALGRRGAAGLPAGLVLAGLLAAGCASEPAGPERPAAPATDAAAAAHARAAAAPLPVPAGFAVALERSRRDVPGGLVEWRTRWVLRWEPVAGAAGYVLRFSTSEGRGGREEVLDAPQFSLDAAAGTSPAARVAQDEAAQLSLSAFQLLVSVAARDAAGTEGAASAWYRVGEVPPGGVPVPNTAPAGHSEGHAEGH
ncbi:hypothetical protein [Kineococcus sp. NUM-3379]